MDNLQILSERANDSLVQSRCDRRSLATLALALFKQGHMISSTSQLIRSIVEALRTQVVNNGAEDILSYEDADRILQQFSIKGLNTNKRQMGIYIRQQGKESLYLDGQPIDYASLQPRTTKKMLASRAEGFDKAAKDMLESGEAYKIAKESAGPEREFRKNPDAVDSISSDEPTTQKTQRWKEELEAEKHALAAVPTNIIVEEETNEDSEEEKED